VRPTITAKKRCREKFFAFHEPYVKVVTPDEPYFDPVEKAYFMPGMGGPH
jgi:hypothetical protein